MQRVIYISKVYAGILENPFSSQYYNIHVTCWMKNLKQQCPASCFNIVIVYWHNTLYSFSCKRHLPIYVPKVKLPFRRTESIYLISPKIFYRVPNILNVFFRSAIIVGPAFYRLLRSISSVAAFFTSAWICFNLDFVLSETPLWF